MLSIRMCKEQTKIAMTENCMDALHIVPKDEMLRKGMPCAKDAIKSLGLATKSCELKWDKF